MTTPIHRSREQIYITKSHLFALGLSTLLVVGISFFVGFRAGASQHQPEANPAMTTLLPEADQQATLEALLRQIEHAQQERPERAFQFPSELPSSEARPIPEAPTQETTPSSMDQAETKPLPSATDGCTASEEGWFVQVKAHDSITEAMTQKETLEEQLDVGVHCYTALVNEQIWYRIRVGPYETESLASTKRLLLQNILDETGFIVNKVP